MAAQSTLPTRTSTMASEDDAVPGEDTSEVTRLFLERLQAWKHAVVYVEDYITATEKLHHTHAKEYNHVLKTVEKPLKEGHHFDQSLGGVAGLFDNLRSNTQGISNLHNETAKALKGTVLPIFERLHAEIKNKSKELSKGAGKGSKLVDKSRNSTQKQIELLGQHTASFDSTGGKVTAAEDPYVLQRGVFHRLNKQILEENNNRQDLLAVQSSFAQFEAHVLQAIQGGIGSFNQVIGSQLEQTRVMYGDVVRTTQAIPSDFEWNGFVKRNNGVLIDPSAPQRSVSNIQFPNQNHRSTQPLIAGSLELKSKLLRKYEPSYYVVTPSKFLHEFKTDDDFGKDPVPEVSLYLPDCVVGAVSGEKFNVKGKDVSKGKVGGAFSMNHEYQFRAHTAADAQQWWEVIRSAAGQVTNEVPQDSTPVSPVDATHHEGYGQQTQGITSTLAGAEKPVTAAEPASTAAHPVERSDLGTTGAPTTAPTATTTTTAATGAAPGPAHDVDRL